MPNLQIPSSELVMKMQLTFFNLYLILLIMWNIALKSKAFSKYRPLKPRNCVREGVVCNISASIIDRYGFYLNNRFKSVNWPNLQFVEH